MGQFRAPWSRFVAGLGLAAGAAIAIAGATALPAAAEGQILGSDSATAIKDSYIVVYRDGGMGIQSASSLTSTLAAEHQATVKHQYSATIKGFAGTMSATAAKRLAADPAVAYVEQDQLMSITATQSPTPSWGLDRIDQRDLPLNNSYTYPDNGGQGITAYIIDTGIRTTHGDFGGRATWGANTSGDGNNTDCNGHGTHVASTTGGTAYGVAKRANLVAVKVLTCAGSGSNAGVIAGVDWVTANSPGPSVANMSLGGGVSTALDNAVANSIASGVTYAVASGNSNANACNSSPARTPSALTVNASTRTDARASFSNYGTCSDIFAPGDGITAAWHTSNTATNTISGTSMASPHVAGAAALQLATNTGQSPAQVSAAIIANATQNKITNPGSGSPNRLLYVGSGGTEPPPPPPGCSRTNAGDVTIPDAGAAVSSSISVTGCSGNASSASQISVDIRHTYRGDLVIDLIAPDGSAYRLKNSSSSDSADNVIATYTVNLSSEAKNGTWRLQARDIYRTDTGYISSFGLTL